MQVDKRVYPGSAISNISIPNGPQFEIGLSISKVNLSLIKLHIILFCYINILCILNFETKFEKDALSFVTLIIYSCCFMWQEEDGNWWVTKDEIKIGYFPATIFNNFTEAKTIGWGGLAISPPNGISPPMGSGIFPDDNYRHTVRIMWPNIIYMMHLLLTNKYSVSCEIMQYFMM